MACLGTMTPLCASKMSSRMYTSLSSPVRLLPITHTVHGWLEGRGAWMGACLVAPSNEVIHSDGEVFRLLKAGAPPPVDHLQLQSLISAHISTSCTSNTPVKEEHALEAGWAMVRLHSPHTSINSVSTGNGPQPTHAGDGGASMSG